MINHQSFSVLLVDADEAAFHLVKRSLGCNSLFPSRVDQAKNLEEARKQMKEKSYHLVIVESELEGEQGLDLFEKVKADGLNLPFVLMTAVRDDELVRKAKLLGVSDLIVKSESHFQQLSEKLQDSYRKFCSSHQRMPPDAAPPFTEVLEENPAKTPITDELTGLFSHSYFHDRVVGEFSRASRYEYPLSCLLVDVDQFKSINEEKGYKVGDNLLKQIAALLFENCRLTDMIARYAGEEFAILLPHIDYKGAEELASRLREIFAEHRFFAGSEEIYLTISIGVSSYPEDVMKRKAELLSYAGQALLRSKVAGRNRVTIYKEITPVFGESMPALKISEEKIMEFQRRMTEISNTARRAYIDASKTMIMALESKDSFTAGHSASCAKYSMQVAEAMGLAIDEAEIVEHAALLHDIGKICIPDRILLKPAKLTFAEFETMKQHAYLGYKILRPVKFLQQEAVLVLHHHEWFNGEGYPCRLKGNEIPLGARIITVIDSYDTMRVAGGRYKKTMVVGDAVNDLIACSGTQFDPEVVKAFIDVLKARKELQTENYNKQKLEAALLLCRS